jgi:spore germination cell wall hydrolase CwlJ-like protein
MPKAGSASHSDYEKYRQYYIDRETSKAGEKKREGRAKARRKEIKSGALTGPHDPRTVDHIKPLAKGGSATGKGNLQVISAKANREKYDH